MGLISKTTTIKWSKNKEYYIKKGYRFTKYGDEFEIKVEDLPKSSLAKVNIICDKCKEELIRGYYTYKKCVHDDGNYYCNTCATLLFARDRRKAVEKHKIYPSKNTFKLSDNGTYWIGTTQKGEEFWFDGDIKIVEYIKSKTWRNVNQGYFQNHKGERLHRIVMGITDSDIIVNHLGGNRWDNRKVKLSISDHEDNSKEKQLSIVNNSGIVGLLKRRDKWVGNIKINHIPLYSKYNTKEEALIDLLIMQKYYGFRHNEHLHHMLDNISEIRVKEVINNIERQLNKKQNNNIICTNKIELSEDGTYYWVYDNNSNKENNRFKISLNYIELIKNGLWRIIQDGTNNKFYVHGDIIINGVRKTVKLHRYLMDLIDVKYKNWYIDHLNGDGLDNTRDNLIITDSQGNGLNKKGKGYYIHKGKVSISLVLFGQQLFKNVKTEQEAIDFVKYKREEAMKQRLQFHSKSELDTYLQQELVQAI